MKPNHRTWAPEELDRLMTLRSSGTSIDDISEILGRTREAVINRLASLTSLMPKRVAEPERVPLFIHSNLTARVCGDPPPGRSALDQRGRA